MRYNYKSMLKSPIFSLLFIFVVTSSLPSAEDMFGYSKVRFFEEPGEETATDTALQTKEEPTLRENIWTEPITGPDGRIYYYTPPKPVLDFISNPDKENAKAYLNWNQARFSAYSKAQEVLNEVIKEEEGKAGKEIAAGEKSAKSPSLPTTKAPSSLIKPKILYFIKSGCEYCAAEDLVMDQWTKLHKGEFDIEGIFVGEGELPRLSFPFRRDRGEAATHGLTKYPTTIFLMPSGKSFGIKGFASGKVLERIYQENKE